MHQRKASLQHHRAPRAPTISPQTERMCRCLWCLPAPRGPPQSAAERRRSEHTSAHSSPCPATATQPTFADTPVCSGERTAVRSRSASIESCVASASLEARCATFSSRATAPLWGNRECLKTIESRKLGCEDSDTDLLLHGQDRETELRQIVRPRDSKCSWGLLCIPMKTHVLHPLPNAC